MAPSATYNLDSPALRVSIAILDGLQPETNSNHPF